MTGLRRLVGSWLSALALCGLPLGAAVAQTPGAEALARDTRLIPYEVNVNNAQTGSWVLLERQGKLYASEDALAEWRLQRPAPVLAIDYRGQNWYPLAAIPGFQATPNPSEQSLDLRFAPAAFAATQLGGGGAARTALSPVEPALFVNYDLSYTDTSTAQTSGMRDLGALLELGAASRHGVLTSSHVGRNLNSSDTTQQPSWVRLETTFTHDVPERQASLRLGDSVVRNPTWGRAVYFGGVQLGRNFALTPGFITQPLPTLTGMAGAPSTMELYVNDVLRQTSNVPAGPFVVNNFPLLTGAGEARLMVRDVLGRETVIDQPFFYSASLLEAGLSDWSVEAGAVRHSLGMLSDDYGERFTAGRLRRGLSRQLTVEGRFELAENTRGAGAGVAASLWGQTLGQLAWNGSHTKDSGDGNEWMVGLERRSLKHGITVRQEEASRDFRHIGLLPGTLPYRRQTSASYSYASGSIGTLGLAYAELETYDRGALRTYSANYGMRVGSRSSLNFLATSVEGSSSGNSVAVQLTIPLDRQLVSASNVTQHAGQTDAYTGASRNLSGDTGVGWRALAGSRSDQSYAEGGVYYQGDRGLVSADISESAAQQTVRIGAQGGLVLMDSRLFASRRLQESFALVEVPGYAHVGVGFQGRVLTHTDADGVALVPRLLPYQTNSIRLDPAELPISAELDSIEMTAVPAARSGVKLVFPVRSGRGALIKIVLADGEPAPAGAALTLLGDGKEFFVARRGEAFVTGLQPRNVLRLHWGEQTCDMDITLPPGSPDDIARVGPVVCQGVQR